MISLSRFAVRQKNFFYQPLYYLIRNESSCKLEPGPCVTPTNPCPAPKPPPSEEELKPIKVKMAITPYKPPSVTDHDQYNMMINRPQSPHLTIYAIELTSTLSITHRITGALIATYVTIFAIATTFATCGIEYYVDTLDVCNISCGSMFFIKFIVAFPFFYHFFNGIRHLTWDTARCLTLKGVYTTGYAMLAVAALTSAYFAYM